MDKQSETHTDEPVKDFTNEELKENINIIIAKIKEMHANNITDPLQIEMYFLNNLSDFYTRYPFLVKKLSKTTNFDTDLEYLYKMLSLMNNYNKDNEYKLNNEL